MTPTLIASSADGVAWNLGDLYAGPDDPGIERDLQLALQRPAIREDLSRQDSGRRRPRAGVPGDRHERTGKPVRTARQAFGVCQPLAQALKPTTLRGTHCARTQEQATAVNQQLIFFDLEWIQVPDEAAQPLIAAPAYSRYRHTLEQKRAWKPHVLTEPEEKIYDEKSLTGRAAFVRLFEETTSTIRFPVAHDGATETLSMQQTLSKLYNPDRSLRKAAAEGLTVGLKENARLLTYIFNNLVLDHQTDCRLRRFPDPMASRHLANEIRPEVVEAL